MKVCVAGASGAFGIKHLDAIKQIDGVEVTSIVGGRSGDLGDFAKSRGIGHWTSDLDESLARKDVDAVILSTPTQMHAAQGIACMKAGKHVMIEIPMADNLAALQVVLSAAEERELRRLVDAMQVHGDRHPAPMMKTLDA